MGGRMSGRAAESLRVQRRTTGEGGERGSRGGGGGDGGPGNARRRGRHDSDDESDEDRGGSDGGKGGGRGGGRGGKGKAREDFEEERTETKKRVGGRRGERDREEDEEEEEGGERWEMGGGRERVRVGRKEKRGEEGRRGGRTESEEREERDKGEGRRERDQMRARDGLGEGERERDVIRGREGGRGRGRDDVDGRRREREDDGGKDRRRDGEMERGRERDGRRGRDRSGRHRRGGSDSDGSESSGEWERERERERGGIRGRGREDRHRRHAEGRREEGRRDRGRGEWEGEERRGDGRGAPVRAPNADAAATPAPAAAATAGGAAGPGAGPAAGKAASARDTGRTGGAYIPPFKLARMLQEVNDRSSAEYQRLTWDALRKSINGLVNKVNASNIKNIIPELFAENLVRGRGLLCRACIKSQMASPTFTHVFAALVAVVNTKFPELGELLLKRIILQFRRAFRRNDKMASPIFTHVFAALVAVVNTIFPELGELLLKRIILQFRRAFRRNDKPVLVAACRFLAHLGNQQVAHEIVALDLPLLPTSLSISPSFPPRPSPPPSPLLQPVLVAACRFLAHLCNQQVAHEIVALELLTLLLETPTDDSVEVAVSFVKECGAVLHDLRLSPPPPSLPHSITHTSTLSTPDDSQSLPTTPNQVAVSFVKECGAMLQDLSPQGLHSIFEPFRGIQHEGEMDKRVQFTIEGRFSPLLFSSSPPLSLLPFLSSPSHPSHRRHVRALPWHSARGGDRQARAVHHRGALCHPQGQVRGVWLVRGHGECMGGGTGDAVCAVHHRGALRDSQGQVRAQLTIEGLFAIRNAKFEGFPARLPELDLIEEEGQISSQFLPLLTSCTPLPVPPSHVSYPLHGFPAVQHGIYLEEEVEEEEGDQIGPPTSCYSLTDCFGLMHTSPHPSSSPCLLSSLRASLPAVQPELDLGFPAVLPELDLVEEEDQITHELSLEEPYDPETSLDVFKFDPDYLANEQRYKEIKAEILGDEEEDEDEKGEGGVNFEEAGHKLMKVNLQPGQEMELCEMLLACCSQERTYLRYYGLLGQRFWWVECGTRR
ncbi:unnamed protein product [Closterium sp. NIES-65]|nr:unnamed protein product [Closterium sp. NIES-65]